MLSDCLTFIAIPRAVAPASQSHFGKDGWDRGEGEMWRASGEELDQVLKDIMEADKVASDLQTKLSRHGASTFRAGSRPSPGAEDRIEVQTGQQVAPWLRGQPTSKERGRPVTVDGSSLRRMPVPVAARPHSTGSAGVLPFGNHMRPVSSQQSRDSSSMRRARGRTPIAPMESQCQKVGAASDAVVVQTQGARRVKLRPGGFNGETSDQAVARLAIASPRKRYYTEQTAANAAAAEAKTLAARARPSPFAYQHDTLQVLSDLMTSCSCMNASDRSRASPANTISSRSYYGISSY